MRNQTMQLLRCAGAIREAMSIHSAHRAISILAGSNGVVKSPTHSNMGFSAPRSDISAPLCSIGLANALQQCGISTSITTNMALAEVAVDGDLSGVLSEIDSILSHASITAKEIADAAVSLAYLQSKGDRLLWGKIFVSALEVKGTFDAASLASFLWAATTAGVNHFKTVAELSGPASSLVASMTPAQLSVVVEALGKAGVKDAELFDKISAQVVANLAKYRPAELSRLLWGFAAAHHDDGALVKAVSKALTDKAAELAPKEAVQAVWALAKLRRTDKPTLDALVKATKGKAGAMESPVDAAALAWSLGFLNYKADGETIKSVGAALKAGASELSTSNAIDAAWGLSLVGSGEKDAISALFSSVAAAVQKDPASVDVYEMGALYNASVLVPGAKLPEQVQAFALKMYNLGGKSISLKWSSAGSAFVHDLGEAVAVAFGARYRPEIAKAVKSYARTTPEGIDIDIAVEVDGTKVAIEPVYPGYASATHPNVLLGPAAARAGLLGAAGYKVVQVPFFEFASLSDTKAKAAHILSTIKSSVPAVKVDALQKKLSEPFDPYAE